ncbi:MAG: hypothetical protein M3P98_00165 [bacterium]|nr:hypothetical protein [bacterium]
MAGEIIAPGAQPPTNQEPMQERLSFDADLSWTASEFVEHNKTQLWYVFGVLITIVVSGLIFFVTRDWFSSIALGLFVILFLVFAARKPKTLKYSLGNSGILVEQKFYGFDNFRSFSIIDEGARHSLSLQPIKRFQPQLNVYFAPQDEQNIINYLGGLLPYEEKTQDYVDRFMNSIKF